VAEEVPFEVVRPELLEEVEETLGPGVGPAGGQPPAAVFVGELSPPACLTERRQPDGEGASAEARIGGAREERLAEGRRRLGVTECERRFEQLGERPVVAEEPANDNAEGPPGGVGERRPPARAGYLCWRAGVEKATAQPPRRQLVDQRPVVGRGRGEQAATDGGRVAGEPAGKAAPGFRVGERRGVGPVEPGPRQQLLVGSGERRPPAQTRRQGGASIFRRPLDHGEAECGPGGHLDPFLGPTLREPGGQLWGGAVEQADQCPLQPGLADRGTGGVEVPGQSSTGGAVEERGFRLPLQPAVVFEVQVFEDHGVVLLP